ncbi:hypothetical protein X726_10400 [Mesorhizobium sp. L103C105A0]|nr:hypothetical protein X726_10400 [Mesorhizobium sp. L103C105A0]
MVFGANNDIALRLKVSTATIGCGRRAGVMVTLPSSIKAPSAPWPSERLALHAQNVDNLLGGDSRSHHPKASFGGLFHVMLLGN